MSFTRRRLPHWYVDIAATFVTWRLAGSLPVVRKNPVDTLGEAFVREDRVLDRGNAGPLWLAEPEVARCVTETLWHGAIELQRYDLHAYVVMPNHVHVLLHARADLTVALGRLKGDTAREANRLLGRTGTPFWQSESFDHWVRSDAEFGRILRYVEDNPVKAGLVEAPELWRWSSAWDRVNEPEKAARLRVRYRGVEVG